jgi:hypothetical protein
MVSPKATGFPIRKSPVNNGLCHLTEAYRRLTRPSSALCPKAFIIRLILLFPIRRIENSRPLVGIRPTFLSRFQRAIADRDASRFVRSHAATVQLLPTHLDYVQISLERRVRGYTFRAKLGSTWWSVSDLNR